MGEPEDFAAATACGLCAHWTSRMGGRIHAMVGRCSLAQVEVSALGTCPSHEFSPDYVERMVGRAFVDAEEVPHGAL